MARSKTPNALEMRELKYGEDTSDTERDRAAQALRAAGRRAEAILLFEGRGDHPFLRDEAEWAVQHGDGFHLLGVLRLGRAVDAETLRACAQSAERKGRWMDARLCYLELGDEAAVRRFAEHLPDSLKPEAEEVPEDEA